MPIFISEETEVQSLLICPNPQSQVAELVFDSPGPSVRHFTTLLLLATRNLMDESNYGPLYYYYFSHKSYSYENHIDKRKNIGAELYTCMHTCTEHDGIYIKNIYAYVQKDQNVKHCQDDENIGIFFASLLWFPNLF